VWELSKEGYTVTVTADGDRVRAVVRNGQGDEVDSTTFAGRSAFDEARWMLDSAVEAGE
jgi:hypothetical protein